MRARCVPWCALCFAACILVSPAARASSDDLAPRYEAALGLGGAKAFENDLFNLTPDSPAKPGAFFDLRVRQNTYGPWSFGFHLYGTGERTDEYTVIPAGLGVPITVRFDVTVFHAGLDARYRLAQGPIQPYLEAGLSYVGGSADEKALGHLNLSGVSVGGGPGVQLVLSRSIALAAEGVFALGAANWDRRPFANSTGRDYNPSLASAAGMFVYRWGS
jgi:hypothetical protein